MLARQKLGKLLSRPRELHVAADFLMLAWTAISSSDEGGIGQELLWNIKLFLYNILASKLQPTSLLLPRKGLDQRLLASLGRLPVVLIDAVADVGNAAQQREIRQPPSPAQNPEPPRFLGRGRSHIGILSPELAGERRSPRGAKGW